MIRACAAALLAFALARPAAAQPRTMGLMQNDTGAFVGYTLFAPMSYEVTYLIDNQGRLIHSWPSQYKPGLAAYLLENGDLLRTARLPNAQFNGGGRGGRLERINWDGNLVWAFEYSTDRHVLHHNVAVLPDGHLLAIAWEFKGREEAIAAGRNPEFLSRDALWPDHVIEIDPGADSIVWEWHAWDHLIQQFDSTKQNWGVVREHPELININYHSDTRGTADWHHCNSVDYNAELDQVMISCRQFSEIWVIDHSTTTEQARGHSGGRHGRGGDLLYRWGHSVAYSHGTEVDRRLFFQHDARWIGDSLNGAGHVLVFNNGMLAGRHYSTVDELVLPADSLGSYPLRPDTTWGPDSTAWSYGGPGGFYADYVSGSQRLPNGNTLVTAGPNGDIFEVTDAGQAVWRYINPVCDSGPMIQYHTIPLRANEVFKAHRYSPNYPAFTGRTLVPGLPIERYPPAMCAPRVPAAVPAISLGPNPTQGGRVKLTHGFGASARVSVFDAAGRAVLAAPASGAEYTDLDLRACGAGVYLVRLDASGQTFTRTITILR